MTQFLSLPDNTQAAYSKIRNAWRDAGEGEQEFSIRFRGAETRLRIVGDEDFDTYVWPYLAQIAGEAA